MAFRTFHYANSDELASACAARIDAAIDSALAERDQVLLALAGGRTSPPVFRRLAMRDRDWSKFTLLPSDERWVAADHADCNLRQMRESFAVAEGMRWLSLVPEWPSAGLDAAFANAALAPYTQPFDVCMLGMGVDGHFASLFPGAPNLARALDIATSQPAIEILPDPMPNAGPFARISLTLSRILHSRRLLLVITGDEKRAVLERARAGDTRLPVAALLAARHDAAEIYWSPT